MAKHDAQPEKLVGEWNRKTWIDRNVPVHERERNRYRPLSRKLLRSFRTASLGL